MSATTMPAVATAEKAGWGTRALAIINIRVVKDDGSYLDYAGVIWAAFDARKQGWHDKIAGTYVVKA
jgi:uncharacterized RDD family membrane protein YckC